jgi:hypothetical protein
MAALWNSSSSSERETSEGVDESRSTGDDLLVILESVVVPCVTIRIMVSVDGLDEYDPGAFLIGRSVVPACVAMRIIVSVEGLVDESETLGLPLPVAFIKRVSVDSDELDSITIPIYEKRVWLLS